MEWILLTKDPLGELVGTSDVVGAPEDTMEVYTKTKKARSGPE